MRERLLAGEELTNRGVQAEYGISNDHTVSDAAARLRQAGHNVIKDQRVEKGPKGRAVVQTFWHIEPKKAAKKRAPKPKDTPSKRPSPKNSVSERLRQRLIDGDALAAQQVADEYGVSRSLLGVVTAQMRLDGYSIEKERIKGGQAQFRLGESDTARPATKTPAPKPRTKSRRAIYADLARRFEAGERIDAHMVMNDYGVNQIRFLAGFLNTQRKKGWTFTKASGKTDEGWRTVYRLKQVDPKKAPAWVDEPSTEEPQRVVDVTDRPQGPLDPAPSDLPQLGMTLRVTLLAEGDEGEIVLGLKNGATSWMVTLRS